MKNCSVIFACVIAALFFAPESSYALHYGTVKVDGVTREFYYYTPAKLSNAPHLVFVLHGSGMTATGMHVLTGYQFDKLADKSRDAIVVYPQAYERLWNDCRRTATFKSKKLKINDVEFFVSMVKYFSEKFNIDERQIFATGYSNGAQMCFKLAKEKPDLFKGFAAVSANLPVETNDDCAESNKPVSMLVMNGTSDPINPFNGGPVNAGDGNKRGSVMSTDRTISYWLKLDGCDSTSKTEYAFPDLNASDHSSVVEDTFSSTTTDKKVVLIKVINGGHIYMNSGFHFWPRSLGNVNKDINGPAVVMDFFNSLK